MFGSTSSPGFAIEGVVGAYFVNDHDCLAVNFPQFCIARCQPGGYSTDGVEPVCFCNVLNVADTTIDQIDYVR